MSLDRDSKGRFLPGHKNLAKGGIPFSIERRINISKALKGRKNPDQSLFMIQLWKNQEYRKKQIESHTKAGTIKPLLSKEELSKIHSKRMKKLWQDPKYRETMKKARGKEWRIKISNWHKKELKENPSRLYNILRRRIPSSFEIQFIKIIEKHNLPYKYVGDGSFTIGRKNPDFININGEKIAIEVYAKYWKEKKGLNIEDWKKERQKVFAEFGWNVFYFDGTELNETFVLKTLKGDLKSAHT